jgi:peroxiredoxin
MSFRLIIGNKARDFKFSSPWGVETTFYEAKGNQPVILIFLRYWGCPICRMEMAKIKKEFDLIRQKGIKLFVVLQSAPQTVASEINHDDFPFTVICDPEGKIFQLYGAQAGGIIRYLHPSGLIASALAIIKGFKHGKFEGKETQLPAAFAIKSDKIIKYAHYGKNIADMPKLSEILKQI